MTATEYIERVGFDYIKSDPDFNKWENVVGLAYLEALFSETERCLIDISLTLKETLDTVDEKFLFNSAMKEHHADPRYNYRELVTGLYERCMVLAKEDGLQSFQAIKRNMTASIYVLNID